MRKVFNPLTPPFDLIPDAKDFIEEFDARYLKLTGGRITGPLGIGADPDVEFTVAGDAPQRFRIQTRTNWVTFDFAADDWSCFLDFQNMADAAHFRVNNSKIISIATGPSIGFFGATPIGKPTVTGSKGGNVALASLLTALGSLGLIIDNTT